MTRPVLLTVDDEPEVLRAVSSDLRRRYGKEYKILRANSGDAALEALAELAKTETPVALVLSDYRMPDINGVDLLARARELHPEARRVLLTAYADTEAAIAAINQSQVDYYLLKPWDPPEERLYPVLDDLLESWRSAFRPGYGGLRLVGTRWSAECHDLKEFLARNHIPYRYFDLETSDEAAELVGEGCPLPVVLLEDGSRLENPGIEALAEALGLRRSAESLFYDIVIVGAGPAGLASAVYAASEGLRALLVEREVPGGQAGTSSRIENYLGFPAGLSGGDLARRAVVQAKRFGVELLAPVEVERLTIDGPYKHLELSNGSRVTCHAVMISTGVSWRRLNVPGAEELAGRGVYYGASISEAVSCRDEVIFTVGAGNSAGQAAIHLSQYAHRVVMLVRGDSLGAKMSNYLVERIEKTPNIEVQTGTVVAACHGEEHLEAVTLRDREGNEERVDAQGLFIFIGAAPRTDWLDGIVARDSRGFLRTGVDLEPKHLQNWPLARPPFLLETNVPGIFTAGDVRHQSVKRVASAAGEGSVAIHFVHRHLADL